MEPLGFSQLKAKYSYFFDPNIKIKCEYGWQKIIEDFCAAIALVLNNGDYKDFIIKQLRQKVGILTIDYDGGDDLIKEIVDFTERLSYNTCEVCGDSGELYAQAKWAKWSLYKTLCHEHAIQFYYYEIKIRKSSK